jgi:hypothetical protein
MPKYKNGEATWSRFKAQIFYRSKGHLDFKKKNPIKRYLVIKGKLESYIALSLPLQS